MTLSVLAALFVLRLGRLWAPVLVRWLRRLGSDLGDTVHDRAGPYLLLRRARRIFGAYALCTWVSPVHASPHSFSGATWRAPSRVHALPKSIVIIRITIDSQGKSGPPGKPEGEVLSISLMLHPVVYEGPTVGMFASEQNIPVVAHFQKVEKLSLCKAEPIAR